MTVRVKRSSYFAHSPTSDGQEVVPLQILIGHQRYSATLYIKAMVEANVNQFPELAVASYNKNPSAPNDPDGIVAVWNLHLLERPEFVFHSPVSITLAFSQRIVSDDS